MMGSWIPILCGTGRSCWLILTIQVSLCIQYSVEEWFSPFSAGKSIARWLERRWSDEAAISYRA